MSSLGGEGRVWGAGQGSWGTSWRRREAEASEGPHTVRIPLLPMTPGSGRRPSIPRHPGGNPPTFIHTENEAGM